MGFGGFLSRTPVFARKLFEGAIFEINSLDDGYLILGRTGTKDMEQRKLVFVKTDLLGNVQNTKELKSTGDTIIQVLSTKDRGFLITSRNDETDNGEMHLIKADNQGEIVWTHTFKADVVGKDSTVYETSAGDYLVSFCENNDGLNRLWLLKFTKTGELSWKKSIYEDTKDSYAAWIRQTKDGGIILAANVYIAEGSDGTALVFKTDADGNPEWKQILSNETMELRRDASLDIIYSFSSFDSLQMADNGYVIFGSRCPVGLFNSDFYMVKLDVAGNILWHNGSNNEYNCSPSAVVATRDGFVVCGDSSTFLAEENYAFLIKFDLSGKQIWSKTCSLGNFTFFNALAESAQGGFLVAAKSDSNDSWIIKTEEKGNGLFMTVTD